MKKWSKYECLILSELYGKVSTVEIQRVLPDRTIKAIGKKAREIGLKGIDTKFTVKETDLTLATKICSCCKVEKDKSSFRKHARSKDGLYCQCKECSRKADRSFHADNKEHRNEKAREYAKQNPDKKKEQRKKYYENNKEVIAIKSKKFREDNKEKLKNKSSEYYQANKSYIKERVRKYKEDNPDVMTSWRENNKEHEAEYRKQYTIDNRAYINYLNAERRAKKRVATPTWVDKEIIKDIYFEANYFQMEVDHIVPLRSKQVCGLHWEGNLQLLTKSNNSAKGNRWWPDMWEQS